MKKLGKNLQAKPTFKTYFLKPIFWGKKFVRETYFLKPIFSTKKFVSNCSAHIAKNPQGPEGRGFRGPGSGEYLVGLAWM